MLFQRMIVAGAVSACLLSADTLTLKSGLKVEGSYMGGDSRNIKMAVGDAINTYALTDVASITFGAPALTPTAEIVTPPSTPSAQSSNELPAGTSLVVRLIDDVNSERDTVGKTYRASLDEQVMMNGQVVLPRNADVLLKLVDDKQAGKLSGKTELKLDVVSVTVNGKETPLNTAEITQASASRTASTAKVVGGTAALGAIIGAIAGGGRGAAIGAASGAGAGTAVQVLTKGQKVVIPSESRLSFVLDQPAKF